MNDNISKEFSEGAGSIVALILMLWLGMTDTNALITFFVSIVLGAMSGAVSYYTIAAISILWTITQFAEGLVRGSMEKNKPMQFSDVCMNMYSTHVYKELTKRKI